MFVSNKSQVDLNSLELMFMYIDTWRMFDNLELNLNAKYLFKFQKGSSWEDSHLDVTNNPDHVALFDEFGINLKVLCGVNGTGKSTILRLLSKGDPLVPYLVVWKDIDDNFLCNEKISISHDRKLYSTEHTAFDLRMSELCSDHAQGSIDSMHISRGLITHYLNGRELFDTVDDELFNGFEVKLWNPESELDGMCDHMRRNWSMDITSTDLRVAFFSNPLLCVFLEVFRDSSFENAADMLLSKQQTRSLDAICSVLDKRTEGCFFLLDKELKHLISEHGEILPNGANIRTRDYTLCEHSAVTQELAELSQRIDSLINSVFPRPTFHVEEGTLMGLLHFSLFKVFPGGEKRFLNDLSSGEWMSVAAKYSLLPAMAQNGIYFSNDEPDGSLHPEWKRRFFSEYLPAIKATREFLDKRDKERGYSSKVYNVILTTHSPFLLSDLPSANILSLQREEKDSVVRTVVGEMPNTFAGNIGEMFYKNLFMESTIGEFAKQKIDYALDKINAGISLERQDEFRQLFGIVGDDLLRQLLLEKLENAKVVQ